LTANDFIILCCGSNDIGKVKLNMVLNDFIEFIKRVTSTNVILLTIPYRHDLKDFNTSLNNEIIIFNKKLLKLEKLFPHLTVIELNTNKHLYTKHGVHLNSLGKEILSLSLALKVFSLIEKKKTILVLIL
jgi:lysophospholipase L1-like esterase